MKLSIVATLYQSAPYIKEFHQRASAAAKQLVGEDYEIVLVNDGSPDDSLDLAVQLTEDDGHVVVVDLSRNFGHHKAMMTGLSHAKGELIFLIDSDLEEEPEWLLDFAEQMKIDASDVVYGVQEKRKGGMVERWTGRWFYQIFKFFTGFTLPENVVTSRLMARRYVDALLLHKERELMIAGLWLTTGFLQTSKTVKKYATSATTYTFRRKMSVLVNSITSFSNRPLYFIFYTGMVISSFSLIYVLNLVVSYLFFSAPISGWTSVIASIWLLGGMVILFVGIVAIYLSKIFIETKKRPYTIVREVINKKRENK
jgi:putative glycosyltransferase